MYEEPVSPLTRFWHGIRKKTADTVGRQAVGFVRGRVAGTTLVDGTGNVVVEAGQLIDDEVITRAEEAEILGALAASAIMAQAQDLQEKASDHFGKTAQGRENWALNTAEAYAEARHYLGYVTGVDVTDIRGEIVIPAGKKLEEDDIRAAREADQLAALIYSVQQGEAVVTTRKPQVKSSETAHRQPSSSDTEASSALDLDALLPSPPPAARKPLPVIRREPKPEAAGTETSESITLESVTPRYRSRAAEQEEPVWIRVATLDDAPELVRLQWDSSMEEVNISTYGFNQYAAEFKMFLRQALHHEWTIFAAELESENRLVGSIYLNSLLNMPQMGQTRRRYGFIAHIYVEPDYRQGDVSNNLVNAMFRTAEDQGLNFLIAMPGRYSAGLLQRAGFTSSTEAMIYRFGMKPHAGEHESRSD